MRTIESIKDNEVVHCPTEQEAIEFCKLLHEAGKTWVSGGFYINKNLWEEYQENTCYNVTSGTYQYFDYFSNSNYIITNVNQFLMKNTNQKVPYTGMQEIYNVACDAWKKKIKAMTSVFEDTVLSKEQVKEMFTASSDSQKEVLRKYLKEDQGNINSWQDVLDYHGVKEFVLPYPKAITKEEKSVNAMIQGFKIAQTFNKGKVLSWENRNEYKYIPYKYFFGGSWVVLCYCDMFAFFPVGLCFTNEKDAKRAYELFPEIYDDYYMFERS